MNEWHQKYGPVIRIAPDELSCTYKPAREPVLFSQRKHRANSNTLVPQI